jgi:multiple sugar transport system substrate-binding protein
MYSSKGENMNDFEHRNSAGHPRLRFLLKASAAAFVVTILSTGGVLAEEPLTGADVTGAVSLRMVSCCKPTYFGPAIETWNAANPDIKIEQEVIPFAQLNDIVESRMRSKDSTFDIVIVDPPRTAAQSAKGYLRDLTATFEGKLDDKVNAESLVSVSYRDKLYAMPVFNSTQVLIYNPEMLEQAGIAAPSIDPNSRTTWEYVIAAAETVKEKLGTDYGIAFSQGHSYYQLQPIIMSAGGEIGLSGENNLTPNVNSAGWKKAMSWYGGLYEDGLAPRGVPFPQMDTIFTSGKAAFLATTSDRIREFQNQGINFRVAAFPKFEGGEAYTPCDSFALGINPYSAHQAQAAKFLEWIGATEEGGFAAASESPNVLANLLVRDKVSVEMEAASPGLDGLVELIDFETSTTCVHRPQSIGYVQFETAFAQKNMDIVNGANASEALDALQNQLIVDFSRIR